nr:hypothetical protein [uncultured Acetatifactor sp.]
MSNKDCEFARGGYCMCDACQSMRKMLEELTDLKGEDIMGKEEAKKAFEEMKGKLVT